MKRNRLLLVGVLVFAVLAAGVAYAHGNQGGWCAGDSGWRDTMNSHMGNTMGPYAGPMGDSSTGHMTARHEGKNGNFDCPG